jgi:hypothetical protein
MSDDDTLVKWWTPTGWFEGAAPQAWRSATNKEIPAGVNADWDYILRDVGYEYEADFGADLESDVTISVRHHDGGTHADGHRMCELHNPAAMLCRFFVAEQHRAELYTRSSQGWYMNTVSATSSWYCDARFWRLSDMATARM